MWGHCTPTLEDVRNPGAALTPFPGASDPKPTFQELVPPVVSGQAFKFIRGPGAPRVPRAAARCALLLLLLALLLLLLLLLLALLLLAARCCARARAPARPPAGPRRLPAGPPPARRRPAARISSSSSASTSTKSGTKNKSTRLPRSLLWVMWAAPRASGWLWWVPGPFAHPGAHTKSPVCAGELAGGVRNQ